jgi:hypothetical protein
MMDKIILSNHSTFFKGRQLVDGVLAINEVVDLAKKSKYDCLIFKVDFENAYDSVSWSFFEYLLKRFGFDDKLCAWMSMCFCGQSLCACEWVSYPGN